MILGKSNYFKHLSDELERTNTLRAAVAFWGAHAADALRLGTAEDVQIICNLTMGGTNPSEIERLLAMGHRVRHSPLLHAKLFRFDDCAVIGSANASANGLSFEATEMLGWSELGIVVSDPASLRDVDAWWSHEWENSLPVGPSDLDEAKRVWALARAKRPKHPLARSSSDLLALLRTGTREFQDRPFYLVCNTTFDDDGYLMQQKIIREERGSQFDLYRDWPSMPRDAVFVDFWVDGANLGFNGIYTSDRGLKDLKEKGRTYQIVIKVDEVETQSSLGTLSAASVGPAKGWAEFWRMVRRADSRQWENSGGASIPFDEAALLLARSK